MNYYRGFIDHFSDIAIPLVVLTKKGVPFVWSEEEDAAFSELKRRLCEAPVLQHFDTERETWLETDSSGWATGATLT